MLCTAFPWVCRLSARRSAPGRRLHETDPSTCYAPKANDRDNGVTGHQGFYAKYGKRAVDLCLSMIAILLLSPVMALVAILVYWKLGSPVLFKQRRSGQNGCLITVVKFRSMTNERDAQGRLLPDIKRLTNFGRMLRRSSLDELPQLFGVLRGEMSLVGPRPLLPEYLPYYTERERKRHLVRPGIAGLAQVGGRNRLPWNARLETDVLYVESQSLSLDTKILAKAVIKALRRSDIDDNSVEPNLGSERSNHAGQ